MLYSKIDSSDILDMMKFHQEELFNSDEVGYINNLFMVSRFDHNVIIFLIDDYNNKVIKYSDDWYVVYIYNSFLRVFNIYRCDTFDGVKELLMDLIEDRKYDGLMELFNSLKFK